MSTPPSAVSLRLETEDGTVRHERVSSVAKELFLSCRRLIGVSASIMQLTRVTALNLSVNALAEIPAGVFAMLQLTSLNIASNRLTAVSREIGRLTALRELELQNNALVRLPCQVCQLRSLVDLALSENVLRSLPHSLGQLQSLQRLSVRFNRLACLPESLAELPPFTAIFLAGNPLPVDIDEPTIFHDSRLALGDIFDATADWLSLIREPATELAIGLQALGLPALVTLEIVDAAFPNVIPMHKKWDLVTAVKHFRQRRRHQL